MTILELAVQCARRILVDNNVTFLIHTEMLLSFRTNAAIVLNVTFLVIRAERLRRRVHRWVGRHLETLVAICRSCRRSCATVKWVRTNADYIIT